MKITYGFQSPVLALTLYKIVKQNNPTHPLADVRGFIDYLNDKEKEGLPFEESIIQYLQTSYYSIDDIYTIINLIPTVYNQNLRAIAKKHREDAAIAEAAIIPIQGEENHH